MHSKIPKKRMSFGRKMSRGFLPGPFGTALEIMFYLTILLEALNTGSSLYKYQTSRDVLSLTKRPAMVQEYVSNTTSLSPSDLSSLVDSSYEASERKLEKLQISLGESVGLGELETMLQTAAPYVASVLDVNKINIPSAIIQESDSEGAGVTYRLNENQIVLRDARRISAKFLAAASLVPAQWMTESNLSVLSRTWRSAGDESLIRSGKFFNELYGRVAAVETLSRMALEGDHLAVHAALAVLKKGFAKLEASGYDGKLRKEASTDEKMALVVMQAYNGERETFGGMQLDGTTKFLELVIGEKVTKLTVSGVRYITK